MMCLQLDTKTNQVACEESIVDSYRLVLALQMAAVDDVIALSTETRLQVHNFVARYLAFSSQLLALPTLFQHVQQVGKISILWKLLFLLFKCFLVKFPFF